VQRNRNSAFTAEKEVQSAVPRCHALLAASSEKAAHIAPSTAGQMKVKAGKNRCKALLAPVFRHTSSKKNYLYIYNIFIIQ